MLLTRRSFVRTLGPGSAGAAGLTPGRTHLLAARMKRVLGPRVTSGR